MSLSLVAQTREGACPATTDFSIAQLYDEHAHAVRRLANRLIGDSALAEDLVHEVFIGLPGALRSYRGEASLRSFLLGVTVNLSKRTIRSAIRRRAATSRYESHLYLVEPTGSRSDPDLRAALLSALDTLSYEQRVAITLCDVEGHTSEEAGLLANAPAETMRTRLYHARRNMRTALLAMGYEEEVPK